nr:hypothetical protein BaRGS_020075 [Batillaria attramentaria]
MLMTLGGDMVSFIQNLDSLHALLAMSYKGINAPSFRSEDLCMAFPYHIVFDAALYVKQCGINIQRLIDLKVQEGMMLEEIATLVQPVMDLSIDNIFEFINAVFVMSIDRVDDPKPLLLRGQMVWMRQSQFMMFIASPRLTSLNELMDMNMYLSDIPIFDLTRDLVLLNQQRMAEIDVAKKLDETTAMLRETSHALEEEKKKTETLLFQMMPKKIAQKLTRGQVVEAEKHAMVTILFSDIVTFTNIASVCPPMEIVNMLNELYQRFDHHANVHDVYKVETIGDAYMVVAGVPEAQPDHAKRVADFAVDMLESSSEVKSPATGKPLQVIQSECPQGFLRECFPHGFIFKRRGDIPVKGKGTMCTFFIVGIKEKRLYEPEDEFINLTEEGPSRNVNNSHSVDMPSSALDTSSAVDDVDYDEMGALDDVTQMFLIPKEGSEEKKKKRLAGRASSVCAL